IPNLPDGTVALDAVAAAVRPDDVHCPRSGLLCLENTHNGCGGVPLSPEYVGAAAAAARAADLAVHVDGARLVNAAVALGVRPAVLVAATDTVSLCLSKGLGAPVGSLLAGPADFICRARRLRKALGGGMRQAGVVAAAGLEALINNFVRTRDDHDNARALSEGLAGVSGLQVD
ncbi:unnamed protein product, partial [Phaeothamnion confervicola]